jgi:hypothetical protein
MALVGILEPGEYKEVMVFSGAEPVFRQPGPGGSHRPNETRAKRRDFSVHDMEAGVTYHSSFSVSTPGLGSPRHHHAFEQIRFVMSGEHEYAGKKYGAGWLGYFPEGVFYGPQQQLTESAGMVMQFPGPSGAPFHSRLDTERGRVLVRAAGGNFEDGICIWPDGRRQDAHEALMEAIYGKDAEYPAPAFAEQIWMNTNNIGWLPTEIPGVSSKRLGYFHQRGPAIQMIKLEPGASIPSGTTGAFMIRYVFEGEAEYAGKACPAVSNLYYPPSAPYEALRSSTGCTILSVELQATIPGTTQPLSEPPLPFRI